MGVFTLLMLSLMQFFNGAQKLWTNAQKRTGTFADARAAMNLMSTQIQAAYYEGDGENPITPFYGAHVNDDYDKIAFVADSPFVLNSDSTSRLYEIGFQVDTSTTEDGPYNTLKIYFIGDKYSADYASGNVAWDFYGGDETDRVSTVFNIPSSYTATNVKAVIPYVVGLKFICLKRDNSLMVNGSNQLNASVFPHAVMIKMSVLDKRTYLLWRQKLVASGVAATACVTNPSSAGSSDDQDFLKENMRTFTTMIYLGERGQE